MISVYARPGRYTADARGCTKSMSVQEQIYLIETAILECIAKHLGTRKDMHDNLDEWRRSKITLTSRITSRSARIIAENRDIIAKALRNEIEKAGYEAADVIEPMFVEASRKGRIGAIIPVRKDARVLELIDGARRQAAKGIDDVIAGLLKGASAQYLQAVTEAVQKVKAGTMTLDKAVAHTIKQWSERGIPSIMDKAGRLWSCEAYASMVVRTNVRNLTTAVQFGRMDTYGVDLMEISSHIGAREGGAPYQGKVFSKSGQSRKYRPLTSTS